MRVFYTGLAIASSVLAFGSNARAAEPISDADKEDKRPHDGWLALDPPSDFGLFRVQAFATRMSIPGFGVGSDDTSRRLVGIATANQNGTMWGGRFGFDFRMGPFFFEVFEISYGMGDGSATAMEQAGGQWFNVRRDPIQRFDFAMPGIGFQFVKPTGGVKLNLKWDVGASYTWANATMTDASGNVSRGSVQDADFFSRAEIAGCKRISGGTFYASSGRVWGCLTAASNVYDKGWFNGASFGARLEF